MADDKPIIIVKKGGGHGGHHGGAWKVAYADFVTAMMAFFMVMWLVNSASEPVKSSIASYFRKPGIFSQGSGTPLEIGGAGILEDAAPPRPDEKKKGSGLGQIRLKKKTGTEDDDGQKHITMRGGTGSAQGLMEGSASSHGFNNEEPEDIVPEQEINPEENLIPPEVQKKVEQKKADLAKSLQELAEQIKKEIAASPELQELIGIVDVKVDADGLNIEIMDTDKTSMFALGSARVQPEAEAAFQKLGSIISKLPNSIDIVGHTDGKPFPDRKDGYSNWELSADRANAARRLLLGEGVDQTRITSVVGRADKELKRANDPFASANRRITLKMRFDRPEHIDLAKDPSAVDKMNEYENSYRKKLDDAAKPKPTPGQRERVHTLTPKEIVAREEKKGKRPVRLPDNPPAPSGSGTPDLIGKNRIFGESPVIGKPDAFSGY